MAEWSQLPPELLDQIAKSLQAPFDHLRFRSVCSAWRSSVTPKPRRFLPGYLILPNDGISDTTFGFHLSKRSILILQSTRLGNQAERSPHPAWVIKIEEDLPDRKSLLNPLSRHRFSPLPSDFPRVLDLSGIRVCELGQEYVLHSINYKHMIGDDNLYMEKVALKWVSIDGDFVLLTIHVSGKLALFRSGNKRWTTINDMPSPYDDVILFKGEFLAVDNTGRTVNVDVTGSPPVLSLVANPVFGGDKKYLVECEGQLLMVDMYLSIDATEGGPLGFGEDFLEHLAVYMSERTVRFKVYKLDEEMLTWVVVRNLGDKVLFLGDHSTFAASASDLSLPKGNYIFFVDNFFYVSSEYSGGDEDGEMGGGRDIGVFDLESCCIGPLGNYPHYSKIFWPPPHWIFSCGLGVRMFICVVFKL
ncbi:F-box protein SKIP23-like [Tripterygium wilfordii]|uniref:F-box protein SKIP23-like n=1 Tax=Tripterygium wilfordii TaxID=458696 RepID=A0A7J7DHF2_TRIWF|nr:F-box protein SKIP23-like [Tripterygium wilfordii]